MKIFDSKLEIDIDVIQMSIVWFIWMLLMLIVEAVWSHTNTFADEFFALFTGVVIALWMALMFKKLVPGAFSRKNNTPTKDGESKSCVQNNKSVAKNAKILKTYIPYLVVFSCIVWILGLILTFMVPPLNEQVRSIGWVIIMVGSVALIGLLYLENLYLPNRLEININQYEKITNSIKKHPQLKDVLPESEIITGGDYRAFLKELNDLEFKHRKDELLSNIHNN